MAPTRRKSIERKWGKFDLDQLSGLWPEALEGAVDPDQCVSGFEGENRKLQPGRNAMTAKEQRTSARTAMPQVDPAQFAEAGKKQVQAMVDLQQELIDGLEEVSREWAARIKAETDLASEFAGKLSAAK